ncbi:deoxyribonuclease-1-like [Dendronephthya gigantea]|uniref:deoxyribonuclease-1-like n=1 Tax=Dendronephthya gigantea TaxID=151771 RepID=UPI00106D5BCB|nr:deoxyribonuclease-1-like [Dendronephthya gigantea]XP_028417652.1 deoxyribonuclease-1-like [Dendronephthya gigantea]XP_028417653.1 deoxyribonuclease-1-like [Dendronephthya gigantea]XP_028417654.1 deoxyribonuclease-1-like [Dendronephthya gigantea]XP_028417655.1 deoxyribonuclease-1-like [Dendronephthya gigantea]XP_028417657.1 deoxyribonuclease-1-like [Dendronephthya gigantea]XP_028417658.1 deoxyribonuclease-1-like [Dendronephthya gigantea]XP_028417659.1 deoxyribonuclease-1-like [Dendronephth
MAYFITTLALVITLTLNVEAALSGVKVAAFNVQVFGQTKISKNNVTDILVKIISSYDIILIQEIRDKKDAMERLLKSVNIRIANSSNQYEMIISGRLGRSASKEQYAFLYRKNVATVKRNYTYNDKNDDFEREPFVVYFNVPSAAVTDMVFIALHTKPDDAVNEIDKLVDVYEDAVKKWNIGDVVIMGDLNAACDYVGDSDWANIRLATDKRFWWLIDDCEDTSVQGSRCAYDRFVATGNNLLKSIVAESPGLFNFKVAYNLNMQEAADVSDHFPIEFELKQKGWKDQETIDYILSSELSNGGKAKVKAVLRKNRRKLIPTSYKKTGGMAEIMFQTTENSIESTLTHVKMHKQRFGNIMGDIRTDHVEKYLMRLQSWANKYPYQAFKEYRNIVDVKIGVKLIWNIEKTPATCQLVISKYI